MTRSYRIKNIKGIKKEKKGQIQELMNKEERRLKEMKSQVKCYCL
jgi:hypothetical protein